MPDTRDGDHDGESSLSTGSVAEPRGRFLLWAFGAALNIGLGAYFLLSARSSLDYEADYRGIGCFLLAVGTVVLIGVCLRKLTGKLRHSPVVQKYAGISAYALMAATGLVLIFPSQFYGPGVTQLGASIRIMGVVMTVGGVLAVLAILSGRVPTSWLRATDGRPGHVATMFPPFVLLIVGIVVITGVYLRAKSNLEKAIHMGDSLSATRSSQSTWLLHKTNAMRAALKGDIAAEEDAQRMALFVSEQAWGSSSPTICTDLRDLSSVLFRESKHEEAEAVFHRWLSIVQRLLKLPAEDVQQVSAKLAQFARSSAASGRPYEDQADKLRAEFEEILRSPGSNTAVPQEEETMRSP